MKRDATKTAIMLLFSLPIKVLHDAYGWRKRKRLPDFTEALLAEYQKFSQGDMTLDQYALLLEEQCGVTIKGDD